MNIRPLTFRSLPRLVSLLLATIVASVAAPVQATFHEWRVTELYSNASGTVQFIELGLPSSGIDNESFVGGHTITESALSHSFTFSGNTVSVPTNGAHLLIATPGYAALSGVPTADYFLPSNNFFSTSGDTINYSSGISVVTFPQPNLPIDGTNSLNFDPFGSSSPFIAVNSPTNLAGHTGSITVPEPSTLALLLSGAALLGWRYLRLVRSARR
jgi:hypothetical protein